MKTNKTYVNSIEKAIQWINSQMLTFDNGFYGIYERIRIDEHMRTNWSRPDCNAEYLRVLNEYKKMNNDHDNRFKQIEDNIFNWLVKTQDRTENSVWKGSFPFYLIDGIVRDEKVGESIYQNDNGKILIAMCQIYKETGDEKALEIAKGVALYWIKNQQNDGTFGVIDSKNMEECRKGPCFVEWLVAGLYLLFDITNEEKYINAAELGIEYLISLVNENGRIKTTYELIKMEDWRPVSSETSIMLYTLSIAYEVTQSSKYLEMISLVGEYVISLQDDCGAIMNCKSDCLDASLQNDTNVCDLVYTQNFALIALIKAFEVTKNEKYIASAFKLGDFLVEIQCEGESILWDGGWRGSYNVVSKKWDGRANQNNLIDEGGMYSVYTGWCCCNIIYGLQLLEQIKKKESD